MKQSTCLDTPSALSAHDWLKVLTSYREPDHMRSVREILITLIPFVALWIAAWAALSVSYLLSVLFIVPAAGFMVRLFLIQHDCGHGSFFRKRLANDWVGRILGILTMTPYDVWKRSHAIHHATSGNLNHRDIGEIHTMTVQEYAALSSWDRLHYRLYRHPIIMFGIGPAYVFLLKQRLPFGHMNAGWWPWISAMTTNLGIAVGFALMMWFVGVVPFLIIHIPIIVLAASIGVWLFYIQHQFEDTVWAEERDWNQHEAALYGSSYYDLPAVLRWFTANIGVHHVHHLYSKIPFYRLSEVLKDHPELASIRRVTLMESFKFVRLKLWDPASNKLVPFSHREVAA